MKDGDEVTGPARAPRQGERHRALVRVNLVNGEEPVAAPQKKKASAGPKTDRFDSLTPVPPSRRIKLPADASALVRAADLLAPLARGQRVLVKAAPRAGRTTLLRDLAQALSQVDGLELTVLLVDERPEEVPAWKEALGSAELALAPADLSPSEQVNVARTALERARKLAEVGADAVLLCDSLSRLAVAAKGVDDVKRLFASGRELEGEDSGSLTVVATTLGDGDDDGSAEKAVATTETSLVTLDATLASEGISPALRFSECRAVGEDKILSEEEVEGLRHLRSQIAELVPPEAAGFIRRQLESASSNAEVLRVLRDH
jgi:transcription termination factor Rho